jgi:hypothetical protein
MEGVPGATVKMPRQIAIRISVNAIVVLIKLVFEGTDHDDMTN